MMASVINIGINDEKNKENAFTPSRTEMSKQSSSTPPNISPQTRENAFTPSRTEMSKQSCSTPPSISPQTRESYWFAQGGIDESKLGNDSSKSKSDVDSKEQQLQKDKEERIRLFREHQEEERLKKLRELEQHFMLSKKHREQQEEERRRKIEEARAKEVERRHQVEERKRQIWEAEQERKEAILRRNMEREARIEARRNAQRNSQCFAFGSSTPRTFDLDLAAIGRNMNQGSVLMSSVSGRRFEERETCPPRATSACSLDRKFGEDSMSRSMISLSSSTFRGRKRTDIMPTMTRERSITPHITPRGKDTSRSPSRPQSSMSGNSEISATSSSISAVNMRIRPTPRRPRPVSVAGTLVDSTIHSLVKKELERQPRMQDKNAHVQKSERAKSASRDKSDINQNKPLTALKKPVPPPKSFEVLARAKSHPVPIKDNLRRVAKNSTVKPILKSENSEDHKETINKSKKLDDKMKLESDIKSNISDSEVKLISPVTSPSVELESFLSSDESKASVAVEMDSDSISQAETNSENKILNVEFGSTKTLADPDSLKEKDVCQNIHTETVQLIEKNLNTPSEKSNEVESISKDLTSAKPRITSEEEAKAALAEKRRLAREQAEREAELERHRLEEIRRIEEEKRQIEEAEQKRMEEEQIRLAKLHRELEEEKLRKAIEEREQRDKEEQEKKNEEARLKEEREEQERKAREEAEKQRIELEEKLRKEEEERAERKRRVEQIMARTRGKSAQSPSGSVNENNFKSMKNAESTNNNEVVTENKSTISNESQQVLNGSEQDFMSKSTCKNNGVSDDIFSKSNTWSTFEDRQAHLPDLLNSESIANHTSVTNGQHASNEEQFSKISVSNSFSQLSNITMSANAILSPQSNGYSSHEEMSCTTSPEENTDTGLLIDVVQSCDLKTSKLSTTADLTKLADLEPPSLDSNIKNENFLINVDDINSNLLHSENSFVDFDDSRQKDKPVVDLLS